MRESGELESVAGLSIAKEGLLRWQGVFGSLAVLGPSKTRPKRRRV
jgi:hypothetical protein